MKTSDNKEGQSSAEAETQDEDEDEERGREDENEKPTAPDGGWGWMVVLGGAITHLMVAGAANCYGLIYLYLMERFEGSAATTATINGVAGAFRFGCGPIASAATNRFSARAVVMCGASLVFIGVALCSIPPNLDYMFFTWSVLFGMGSGLCLIPGIITVGRYFDKRRGMANGFSTAGSGIGQFTFPLLYEYLLGSYGYYGCMLILSAILLHLMIPGALFRPLMKSSRIKAETESEISKSSEDDFGSLDLKVARTESRVDEKDEESKKVAQEKDESPSRTSQSCDMKLPCVHNQLLVSDNGPKETRNNCATEYSYPANTNVYGCCTQKCKHRFQAKNKILDLSLLTDPVFVMYAIFLALGTMSYILAKMFIPALVASRGFSTSFAAQLLSWTGLADMLGRISAGFLFDLPKVRPIRRYLYNCLPFILSMLCAVYPFARTNTHYTALSVCFGFHVGLMVSQLSSILADLVGTERFSSAVGLLMFFRGTGIVIGPAVGGALRDVTGKYDGAYYFAACASGVGALLFLCQNLMHVHKQRMLQRRTR